MKKRDVFPIQVKRTLAERAGQRCSNPDCKRITSGPHTISNQSIIVGVAAHIFAAAPGGKRYDPNMTPEQRSSIENGIWLCQTCAKLIDSDEKKYTPELLKKWKIEHENSISKELVRSGLVNKEFVEAVPKVTARVLVDAGLNPAKVHLILKAQDKAAQQKNDRLANFLNSYVDKELHGVPPVWRALIAGFPIIGEDICSQSLNDLAKLVEELHPYLSKELREEYHSKAQQILIGILAELQAFLQDAAKAGGIPLAIMSVPPPTWKDWLPWLWDRERSWKADESLVRGCWAYLVPKEVIDLKIEINRTWAGFLYDIISRLPDPDRQKGKLLKNLDLPDLVFHWCSTAPDEFKPALTKIVRKPVNISDHTLAGVYKRWKENFGKLPD